MCIKFRTTIIIWITILFSTFYIYPSETIRLKFPIVDIHSDYYYKILKTALTNAGFQTVIEKIDLPSQRAKAYLESGDIDIIFMIRNDERDSKYVPIPIGLTNGLIASRVLFVPVGDSHIYENVTSLEDLQNLDKIVGMGAQWFDVKVWEANNLPVYKHSGEYTLLFGMVAQKNRGLDYYSTGFNEALDELEKFGSLGLEIEPGLILIYERDYIFYMSTDAAARYKTQIDSALKLADESGIIDQMVREYWAEDFHILDYDGRRKIYLETPR